MFAKKYCGLGVSECVNVLATKYNVPLYPSSFPSFLNSLVEKKMDKNLFFLVLAKHKISFNEVFTTVPSSLHLYKLYYSFSGSKMKFQKTLSLRHAQSDRRILFDYYFKGRRSSRDKKYSSDGQG